ncbi:ABC-2 family transporter protein [Nocardioides sp. LMS-CY]|uniref:ABC transporter permease n=1 Tax=Nocardioides sp. (strain LMS-CY) TaxID=2840457 RepID=UPI001BFFE62F|nr:ABC-2 family transporter protein [Nocardioides sp. LMS-CY]QWF24338.1 ABC-2 family transporter protein [Nocardioides sp. LMS-CY]
MRTYLRLFVAGFRRQSTYRLAAFGGLVANTAFGLLKVALLFAAVRTSGGELAGYDVAMMSSYIWISQGMLGSVNLTGRTEIADRIRTGDVAVDFLRPLDVHLASVTTEVGRAVFALIPRGIPSVVIGALLVGMAVPEDPWAYPLGAVSLLLGIVVSATTVYLVGVSGFWLLETRGVALLYMVVSGFLAGLFVPIALFPDWLRLVATATPFPAMMMYPVDVLSGRVGGAAAVGLVALQVLWLVLTVAAGQLATRVGRRRLEVQGG